MVTTIQRIELITTDPGIRGGRPVIAGTTLEVSAIAIAKIVHRQTPETIADDYRISLPEVYAALSYYYAHKDEIDASIRERRQLAEELKGQLIASGHSRLHRREPQPEDR